MVLKLAANAHLRNLGLFSASGSMVEPKNTVPSPVLPVMMSIIVVLPAPLGADDAAQLSWGDVQAQFVDGFEAVNRHGDAIQVQDATAGNVHFTRAPRIRAKARAAPT